MPINQLEQPETVSAARCVACGGQGGTPRIDIYARSAVTICDACCDRRAVQCPFCGSPFGREVRRASRCKKCGETVARNSRSPLLATRLATPAICASLAECDLVNAAPFEQSWLRSCLFTCLLEAAQANGASRSLDSAFASSLRSNFEKGLTRDRLSNFGFGFARAIWLCGGNPRAIQRTLQRSELESLRASGLVASVEVLPAGDPCENCKALRGKVWTIDEALAANPLPCRDCLATNDGGFGWCRCCYQPRLADDYADIAAELDAQVAADNQPYKG